MVDIKHIAKETLKLIHKDIDWYCLSPTEIEQFCDELKMSLNSTKASASELIFTRKVNEVKENNARTMRKDFQ